MRVCYREHNVIECIFRRIPSPIDPRCYRGACFLSEGKPLSTLQPRSQAMIQTLGYLGNMHRPVLNTSCQ